MGYVDFFKLLKVHQHRLTRQELLTLRGQAMAGQYAAAQTGLFRIIARKDAARRTANAQSTEASV